MVCQEAPNRAQWLALCMGVHVNVYVCLCECVSMAARLTPFRPLCAGRVH